MTLSNLFCFLEKRKIKLRRSIKKHQFNFLFNAKTITNHDTVLAEAEFALRNKFAHENLEACLNSQDPLVRQGTQLKRTLELEFRDSLLGLSPERILIQIPSPEFSPAGFSLFSNLLESLNYIGIPAEPLDWDKNTEDKLMRFCPTVLLSSDHEDYLDRIDWRVISQYKRKHNLRVGLTAALEEYGNKSLLPRLAWARRHEIDFYYSFRDEAYLKNRKEYEPFFSAGYKILHIPFGANILHYFPVDGFSRDLNYVLIASRKREHIQYLKNICHQYSGFIDGPGWKHVKNFQFNRARDRYIYARAKVALNIHLPEQIDSACELNERTYQLAACGVPQLIDNPGLLRKVFGHKSFFIAKNPDEYETLFKELIHNPQFGVERALYAQQEVFASHTTFHRAKSLIDQLKFLD
ncbi:glycosyltransferase [Polynucleobacter sp. AP-Feld-500C-C5]|uniref:glycosyltransferase family protein n=1 Tax=Polynucleobacter sp. AP-Feld-500C-C5 TaxID=2576924 RepID=UPI001C0CCC68|nr:glycosyltransferase [Polynucleobacter sp. AP-Feld-500C-C5]MBU3632790.1 glycosyltransferase family 1 protein [Polynucleobacter sp. AP-Feld-500C-C5]